MAIAVEAVVSAQASGATSVTTPSITPAGANRLLMALGGNSAGTVAAYSDMTYAAGQMTAKWDVTYQTYFRNVCEFLVAPSTGGGVVVYTVAATQDELGVGAVAYSGVDQTTPLDTEASANAGAGATSISVNVAGATDDLVADFLYGSGASPTINQSNTSRFTQTGIGGGDTAACGSTKASSGTTTMGWAFSSSTYGTGIVGVNINADAGAGGTANPWYYYAQQ